jgi:hypothetical protein
MLGSLDEFRIYREQIREQRAIQGLDTFDVPGDSSMYRDTSTNTSVNPESERPASHEGVSAPSAASVINENNAEAVVAGAGLPSADADAAEAAAGADIGMA